MDAGSDRAGPQTSVSADRRQCSVLRAIPVGLASLGLGLAAHTLSGGAPPSAPILAGLAALAVLVATLVAQVRLPVWAVMLVLGCGQQLLHWIFGGLGGASSSSPGSSFGHHGDDVPVGADTGGADTASGHSPEAMLMLHTHLAAALLVGWLVLRFSAVFTRLERLIRGRTAVGGPNGRRPLRSGAEGPSARS